MEEDTVKTLAEKSQISEKELIEAGLDPDDNIGRKKQSIIQAYRSTTQRKSSTSQRKPPTSQQVEELLNLGINLEKRDTIEEFIEELKKIKEIRVDITKIIEKDTVRTLAEKSQISEKELINAGLDPNEKIGVKKKSISQAYNGTIKSKPPTSEQVEKLLTLGIRLDRRKITGEEIAEATIDSLQNIEMVYTEESAFNYLVGQTQEGEIKKHE